jgi:large subunit ribosomal protein L28
MFDARHRVLVRRPDPRSPMSVRCQVLGTVPGFGHSISHSHVRTKRRFDPNVQRKRYWVPSLGRHVRLTVSVRGIRTIDRRGIDAVVAEILARGERI